MTAPEPRIPQHQAGLDTLRAIAIALVFMYHYEVFVSREATFGWLSEVGWVGVDLFFVLSGYLIANGLLGGLVRGRALDLGGFYARRIFRTWPVYWLVVAAYFLAPALMGGKAPPPLWRFLTFTQNWGLQPGTAFSHAWSLCIEEQFYATLPLAALLGAFAVKTWGWGRRQAWGALALLLALGVGTRALLWSWYGREDSPLADHYYPWVYYGTLCRFDEFLPGVALAMLKHLHPGTWRRLMGAAGRWLLPAALLALLAMGHGVLQHYYIDGYGYGGFMSIAGYSLVAMSFGLLVAAAMRPGSWLQRTRVPGAATLAAWSYPLYLSHKPVAYIVATAGGAGLAAAPGLRLALVTLACLAVAALLHYLVERPGLRLRERWFPNQFKPAAGAAPRAADAVVP
ncbi:MAG TPA: acyltransferase [Ideonella sp.]|uniref:acyltransferase family protein n=1 Tax=Ideonella sp. TaxID=1929293 RepID=UPI002BA17099|nr:acyltransferase [Ideonella sp.]HSI48649.1 acyltransferase [Ideonella sp.]